MARKSTRIRQNRRDRRKAKESEWKRPGKSNPRIKTHGGSGARLQPVSHTVNTVAKQVPGVVKEVSSSNCYSECLRSIKRSPKKEPSPITLKKAAERANVSIKQIRELMEQGEIEAVQSKRGIRIQVQSLRDYLAKPRVLLFATKNNQGLRGGL